MSQRIRSNSKWEYTFYALTLASQAVGDKPAKQFLIPDSENLPDVERSFSPQANENDKANARKLLEYCFIGDGFDITVDRGNKYWEGQREVLSGVEKQRRHDVLNEIFVKLGLK